MPTRTKYELKLGMATREAFGQELAKLGAENRTEAARIAREKGWL
jgi:hypothetical protein